jgi:hypothetical protein
MRSTAIPFGTLEWRQTSVFHRDYQLCSGDRQVAGLTFRSALGSLAEAGLGGERFTFKRTGFLSRVVTARREGGEENLAEFRANWCGNKGELRLQSGDVLGFRATSMWGRSWELSGPAGGALLTFRSRGVMRHGAEVEVDPAARERADLPLLLLLGWYILLLHKRDAASTGG